MATVVTDRRQGVNSGASVKVPCRVATTANITLSGLQSIDGVTLVAGDRVLVKDQTIQSENGIYAASSSTWQRDLDWDGSFDIKQGTSVRINAGTVNAGQWFAVATADPITVGTTSVTLEAAQDLVDLAVQLANTTSASAGDALIGVKRTESNSVATTQHVVNEIRPIYITADFGAVGDGSTNDRTVFSNADAAAGATKTIYIPAGTYRIGSNITLSADYAFAPGAKLKPDAGVTITFNGQLRAGLHKIFDLTNAGSSVTGLSKADPIYPHWWGAVGDGVTDDRAAFNSAGAVGKTVTVPPAAVSYNLSSAPTGTFVSNEEVSLSGAGNTLVIKRLIGYNPQNDVTDVPGAVRITANNVSGIQQLDEFGNYSNISFIDGDGNCCFGPTDPRMFNLFFIPRNGRKELCVESHYFVDLAALAAAEFHSVWAAHGCYESQVSTGSTVVDLQGNGRGMIEVSSGSSSSEAGWLFDFKNMQMTVDSFNLLELMYDMPDSLQQRVEFGLWDGTLNNAIYCERAEAGTSSALVAKTYSGGVGTSTAMSVGNDALRHSIRIYKSSSSEIKFYDSNSDVAAGQFQLVATNTTNITSSSLRPFIRFRSLGGIYDRAMRWDKLTVIGNW